MSVHTLKARTQGISDLINLDTYTADNNLLISKAHNDQTYIGRTYVMSPLLGGGAEFSEVIASLFKTVPDNSIIQFNLVCEPDPDAAHIFSKGKHYGGEIVQDLIARQHRLISGATQIGWQPDVPLLNRRSLLISLATPVRKVTDEHLEEAVFLQNEFLNNTRNSGFGDARTLTAGEVLGYYSQFAGMDRSAKPVILDELVELKYQAFGPDQTIDFRDSKAGLFNNEMYCAAVAVKSFPENVFHGLMNLATGAPFNHGPTKEGGGARIVTPFIYNTTIRVANQRKEMKRVEDAISSRRNRQTLPSFLKLGNENPEDKLADLEYMRRQCTGDGDKFVYVSSTAFLFASERNQAIESATTLKSTLDKLGFDARLAKNDSVVRWAQGLPINFALGIAEKLANESIMPLSAAGCLVPVYGDNRGNALIMSGHTGAAFITRRGSIHLFDAFVSNDNYCGTMCAPSGAGKTFFLQYLISCDLAEKTNVFLLEVGQATKKFCKAVGGEFNEFTLGKGYTPSLNPFTGLSDEQFNDQQEMITSLLLLMAFENEAPQPGSKIAMAEAVRAAHAQKGDATEIMDVVDALMRIRDQSEHGAERNEVENAATNLIPRLDAFIKSPSRGRFFNGPGTINIHAQFTVFDMGGLKGDEHLRKCVTFFVINMLMTRISSVRGRKKIYIDEALDLFSDKAVLEIAKIIYLQGRKHKASIFSVIHSLVEFAKLEAGQLILANSAWKLVLSQTDEEIDSVFSKKLLSSYDTDPYFQKLVKSIETRKGKFSEVLIVGKDYYEAVRLYVDKFTATLFSSEDDARDVVFDLMDSGMSAVDAVHFVMGDKKKSRLDFLRLALNNILNEDDNLTADELMSDVREVLQ